MGGNFLGQAPFRKVLITPLVRDKTGKKMSKSIGNVVNPMDMIQLYGADALRFGLIWKSTGTQDLRFDVQVIESSRKFITKVWNSVRLGWQKDMKIIPTSSLPKSTHPLNRWIVAQILRFTETSSQKLDNLCASEYAHEAYIFWWHTWCDIYLEGTKILMDISEYKEETQEIMGWGVSVFLKLMHPIIPWTTDVLWNLITRTKDDIKTKTLLEESWPQPMNITPEEKDFASEIQILLDDFAHIRSQITVLKQKCSWKEKGYLSFTVLQDYSEKKRLLEEFSSLISLFTGTSAVKFTHEIPSVSGMKGIWSGGEWHISVPEDVMSVYIL
jgi:valyl-tRNA synthetase